MGLNVGSEMIGNAHLLVSELNFIRNLYRYESSSKISKYVNIPIPKQQYYWKTYALQFYTLNIWWKKNTLHNKLIVHKSIAKSAAHKNVRNS